MNTITDADLERLDDFLACNDMPAAMDVATLEGFLTALVIGPQMVMPSHWLPWVWDLEHGQGDVEFDSNEQASEIIGLIMGLSNQIASAFQRDPAAFEPVFYRHAVWGASEWCEGFLKATALFDAQSWAALWALDAARAMSGDQDGSGDGSLVTPFLRLGDAASTQLTGQEDARRWVDALVPALVRIHAHWLAHRIPPAGSGAAHRPLRRTTPKVGRNSPCPCGSGKKYKHCCGRVDLTLH